MKTEPVFAPVTSAQSQGYQITSASSPQWLQYSVASAKQDCSDPLLDNAYRSSPSPFATGNSINLCVRGIAAPGMRNGNYQGTITIGPAPGQTFAPFHLIVKFVISPGGYLQLFTPDQQNFGAGTINVAVKNGSLALSPVSTVVCNVLVPNAGTGVDQKAPLSAEAYIPNTLNTIADWVVLSFDENSISPANLSIKIDPVKARNQPDLSATIRIHSAVTKTAGAGEDFVFLLPDATTMVLPTLSVAPNPINLTGVAGSHTAANQTVMVSTGGPSVTFGATATTSDGGNWLSILQPNGTTPATFTVVLDPTNLVAKAYTGTVTITAPGVGNSPFSVPVNAIVTPSAPVDPIGQTLVSGTPILINLPGVLTPTLFNGTSSNQIVVPQGATSLQLQTQTTGNVGLYARLGADVGVDATGQVIADAGAPGTGGGGKSITLTSGSSPALRAGLWFISLSNLLNTPAQVTLTGTITNSPSAGPLPTIFSNGVVLNPTNPGVSTISPGAWVSIYGDNLAPNDPGGRDWGSIAKGPLPSSIDGVSVTIDGKAASVNYIAKGLINVQAPDDVATGMVNVVVTTSNGQSAPGSVNLQTYSPALFAFGTKYAVAQIYPDNALAAPVNFVSGVNTRPAKPGDIVTLYGTGFGPTKMPAPAGFTVDSPVELASNVTATVGGVSATVNYAGLTGAGLNQFTLVVPNVSPGDQTLVLTVAGVQTLSPLSLNVGN